MNLSVHTFGKQAKEIVLTQAEAIATLSQAGLFLEGLTGAKDGIIRAIALICASRRSAELTDEES